MSSSASALRGPSTGQTARPSSTRPRILLVDDEPNVLDGLRRQLRTFDVTTATSGAEAIELVRTKGPFVVAMTDMRMPGMDGVAVLRALREAVPDTVRVLLTGFADLQSAIDAVNEGAVFRFLSKPCPPEVLQAALGDAVRQHQLVTAERELLEETLQGSVRALIETLSLANPMAFARAVRMRGLLGDLLDALELEDRWEVELACMLGQVGAVTLGPAVVDKLHRGLPLSDDERDEVRKLPEIADRLLAEIPGWTASARSSASSGGAPGQVKQGALILRVVTDFDTHEASGMDPPAVLAALRAQAHLYDQRVLDALGRLQANETTAKVRQVDPEELLEGMVLAADLRTVDGMLLVGRGQPVTPGLIERIRNFSAANPLASKVSILYSR